MPWRAATDSEDPAPREAAAGQGQTIMVIEDDPGVTAVVTEGLNQLGYQVINVQNGEQALDSLERTQVDRPRAFGHCVTGRFVGARRGRSDAQGAAGRAVHLHVGLRAGRDRAQRPATWAKVISAIDILSKPFQLTDLADRVIEALAADA